MLVKVVPQFFRNDGKQTFCIENMTVTMGDRVVGKIIDFTADYTEIDIIDPVAIGLIKSGINNSSVSMGCKVNDGIFDTAGSKSKVKSDSCGYLRRLKELGIMTIKGGE
jgi:hypothetical protein